jgi:hypothetical protein
VLWCLVLPVYVCGGGWLLGDRGVCCSGDGFCGCSLLRRRLWWWFVATTTISLVVTRCSGDGFGGAVLLRRWFY